MRVVMKIINKVDGFSAEIVRTSSINYEARLSCGDVIEDFPSLEVANRWVSSIIGRGHDCWIDSKALSK